MAPAGHDGEAETFVIRDRAFEIANGNDDVVETEEHRGKRPLE
jgi:DNA-directed RNA polymerase subunit K/omega